MAVHHKAVKSAYQKFTFIYKQIILTSQRGQTLLHFFEVNFVGLFR